MSKQSMGDELRRRILESQATQSQIAAGSGCSQSMVSRVINGNPRSIRLDTYERIMGYLNSIQRTTKKGRPAKRGGEAA
jgi:transcriptional regulator with XRE-family HTH domain